MVLGLAHEIYIDRDVPAAMDVNMPVVVKFENLDG